MCMYVCFCACKCTYVYTCICAYVCVCTCVCIGQRSIFGVGSETHFVFVVVLRQGLLLGARITNYNRLAAQ